MSYSGIIRQIKDEIAAPLVDFGAARDLIEIIFNYSGDVEMELFAGILAIRTGVYEIKSGMMCNTIWEYKLSIGLSGHHERRKMFFDMKNMHRSRNCKNRGIYKIPLSEAFCAVHAGDYFNLAQVLRQMMFKPYRLNVDKLTYVGSVLEEIILSRATIMLDRFLRRRSRAANISHK